MNKKEFKYAAPGIEVLRFDAEGVICGTQERPGGDLIYDEDDF